MTNNAVETMIPVSHKVLKWARESAGLSSEEVARKLGRKSIKANDIEEWERGESAPNYVQLEVLAYQIYKRPLAIFFFPEPPEEETPKQSFRTLPEQEIKLLSPKLNFLIRRARAMQINLAELNDGVNPAKNQIIRDLKFDSTMTAEKMAAELRKYLDVGIELQSKWRDTDAAFKAWREILESRGLFIFKEPFKDDRFSGFCIDDQSFPVIYINNSQPHSRQIFTLFHELAHLLLGTGGVDTRLDDYIKFLSGDDRKIEVLCNSFSGIFLVPDVDFDAQIKGMAINDAFIEKLANRYSVSREVILRKFFDRGQISKKVYEQKSAQWIQEAKSKAGKGGSGNYYLNERVYLGENYIELAFSRYYQKRISVEQLADYLGVKVKSVSGIEALLVERGAV